ncbi:MAG: type II toxin-antitoxin system VapC family toxin [Candidatus Freyarchaeota archaeon]|nr:type II toxin-antitoxin system VapC family toxin [Candidatus Jordarchaeia archaeon]MBS7270521.1 type II toxin-antitoxin system VapC family toxin [Candidatus Jordarchaeia archaeon]MBS7281454.1 type II toxin-antitoxin system VapC family toxin [Candidatus Jordarchaeia archaeon]
MRVVVDTDALINLGKIGKLERFVEVYDACITAITEYEYIRGEIRAGVNPEESKRTVGEAFEVLPLDNESISTAGRIWAELTSRGEPIEERDLLTGAICISKTTPLWTLNKKNFKKLEEFGLKLLDTDIENL